MSVAQRARQLCVWIGFATLAAGAAFGHTAEQLADFLAGDWYVTEVIVFQRGRVMEMNSPEKLIRLNATRLPGNMRTFFPDPGQIGAGYDLDPLTRATLEFPTLQPIAPTEVDSTIDASASPPDLSRPPPAIHPVLEPNPLLDLMALVSQFERQLHKQSYRWLPAAQMLMLRDARLIDGRGGNRVLLHGRWLQPVPSRERPEPIFIQAGSKLSLRYQLEGVIAITLGRYLHFRAQLSYREPGMGQRPVYLPARVGPMTEIVALPGPVPGSMVLDQSRRMRSNEIHYLDHPKLGVIVRIDPIALPNDLIADFEALKETSE
ncbi:MAG: CsiV family protein [Gammaproteobacteria bacterium]|nr:CsiV family protein [Gammaproteobacteria bacterium]